MMPLSTRLFLDWIFVNTAVSLPAIKHPGKSGVSARQADGGKLLTIMCVGASNTTGSRSLPEDGFRKQLRNILRYAGFAVNMVGSQFNAGCSMRNGAHEG
jgi:hypothetical protein